MERNIFRIYTNDCDEYIKFIESRNDDITIIECCQAITTDILLPKIKNIKGKVILHGLQMEEAVQAMNNVCK